MIIRFNDYQPSTLENTNEEEEENFNLMNIETIPTNKQFNDYQPSTLQNTNEEKGRRKLYLNEYQKYTY